MNKKRDPDQISILYGHTDEVTSVQFSPIDDIIVSGSKDKTVRIWDSKIGKEISKFENKCPINAVAFSPKGDMIACGGMFGISLWDLKTKKRIRENCSTTFSNISCIRFSSSGDKIVSGSWGKGDIAQLRVCNLNLCLMKKFYIGKAWVQSIEISASGEKIALGLLYSIKNHSLQIWNYKTGKKIVGNYLNSVKAISFFSKFEDIIAGDIMGNIRIWNPISKTEKVLINLYRFEISSIILLLERQMILIANEKKITLWDMKENKIKKEYEGHGNNIHSMSINHIGNNFVSGSADHALILWRFNNCANSHLDSDCIVEDLKLETNCAGCAVW